MIDWQPFWLTAQLATATTLVLLALGIPLAWWLARGDSRSRLVAETLISLPLVLPPTVLGFYLLLAFSPRLPLGAWLAQQFDLRLAFTFSGLVIGSVIFSLPFMVQPLVAGFRQVPQSLLEAARTLGHSEWSVLWRVLLPLSRPALLTALVLSFAHTVGEFGVVLMLGGNIPEETRVVSIALYHEVDSLHYGVAHRYAAILVGFSFLTLLALRLLARRLEARQQEAR